MDSFDKKIKETLSPYEDQIPEGMSWDEMAPGIMERMEENDDRKFPLLWVLLGVGLISLSAFSFIWYHNSNDTISPLATPKSEKQITKLDPKTESIDNTITPLKDIAEKEISENKTKSKTINTIDFNSKSVVKASSTAASSTSASTTKDNATSHSHSEYSKEILPNVVHVEREIAVSASINKEELVNSFPKELTSNYDRQSSHKVRGSLDHSSISISDQSLQSSFEESSLDFNNILGLMSPSNDKLKPRLVESYYIGLDAGLTVWDWNQEKNAPVDISTFEREQLSYNANVRAGLWIGKYLSIESGFGYKSYESEFNAIFLTHRTEVSDTIDQPIYNVITRVTHFEENAVVEVFEKRTIRHFNSIKQFNIPFIASVHFNKNKWDFSTGLGASLTYLAITNGKSINDQSTFVDYSENTSLRNFTGISLLARVGMEYRLLDRTSIYADFSLNQSLNSWTKSMETGRTPFDFNINLGVKKRFNFQK